MLNLVLMRRRAHCSQVTLHKFCSSWAPLAFDDCRRLQRSAECEHWSWPSLAAFYQLSALPSSQLPPSAQCHSPLSCQPMLIAIFVFIHSLWLDVANWCCRAVKASLNVSVFDRIFIIQVVFGRLFLVNNNLHDSWPGANRKCWFVVLIAGSTVNVVTTNTMG